MQIVQSPSNCRVFDTASESVYMSLILNTLATRISTFSKSGVIVQTSDLSQWHPKPSYSHRWKFSSFGDNFGGGRKIFGMQKNFRRSVRWFIFVMTSCVHLTLRNAIVQASCHIVLHSAQLRVIIGPFDIFAPRRQYDGNKKLSDSLTKATRLFSSCLRCSSRNNAAVVFFRVPSSVIVQ